VPAAEGIIFEQPDRDVEALDLKEVPFQLCGSAKRENMCALSMKLSEPALQDGGSSSIKLGPEAQLAIIFKELLVVALGLYHSALSAPESITLRYRTCHLWNSMQLLIVIASPVSAGETRAFQKFGAAGFSQ